MNDIISMVNDNVSIMFIPQCAQQVARLSTKWRYGSFWFVETIFDAPWMGLNQIYRLGASWCSPPLGLYYLLANQLLHFQLVEGLAYSLRGSGFPLNSFANKIKVFLYLIITLLQLSVFWDPTTKGTSSMLLSRVQLIITTNVRNSYAMTHTNRVTRTTRRPAETVLERRAQSINTSTYLEASNYNGVASIVWWRVLPSLYARNISMYWTAVLNTMSSYSNLFSVFSISSVGRINIYLAKTQSWRVPIGSEGIQGETNAG